MELQSAIDFVVVVGLVRESWLTLARKQIAKVVVVAAAAAVAARSSLEVCGRGIKKEEKVSGP